jgi:hypothetical protein
MPYRYRGWTLYSLRVTMKDGTKVTIYFFARRKPKTGSPVRTLPPGRTAVWDEAAGEPILRRTYRRYQITEAELAALRKRQGNRCAICGRRARRALVIDHSHATNLVRGLLCGPCNTGLGMFGDDPDRLLSAAQYLNAKVKP